MQNIKNKNSRTIIISEIKSIMENHGTNIDCQHLILLADLMSRGEVLTRGLDEGIDQDESLLNLLSVKFFTSLFCNIFVSFLYNNF